MYLKILNEDIIENVHAVNKRAHWSQGLPYYNEETFMFEYPDGSTSVNLLKIADAPERFKLSTPEPQTSSHTTTTEVDVVVQARDVIDNSDLPEEKKEEAKGKIDDAVQQAQDNNSNPAAIIALILIGYGLYKFARYIFSDKKKRKYRRTYYDDD